MEITVSCFAGARDNDPMVFETCWSEFGALLAEFAEAHRHPSTKLETPAISPAVYPAGAKRLKAAVVQWGGWAAFDIDNHDIAQASFDGLCHRLQDEGRAFVLHTTTKSTADVHRLRLIMPLSRPVLMDEFDGFWLAANAWLGGLADPSTCDPSRIFFVPARWDGANNLFEAQIGGMPLDVDALPRVVPSAASPRTESCPVQPPIRCRRAIDPTSIVNVFASPLLSPHAVRAFADGPEGGRLFRLMCSIAARAARLGYPASAEEVEELALTVDRLIGPPKARPGSHREAQNALSFVRRNTP